MNWQVGVVAFERLWTKINGKLFAQLNNCASQHQQIMAQYDQNVKSIGDH